MVNHKSYVQSLNVCELLDLHSKIEQQLNTFDIDENILSNLIDLQGAIYMEMDARGIFRDEEDEYPWQDYEQQEFDSEDYPF